MQMTYHTRIQIILAYYFVDMPKPAVPRPRSVTITLFWVFLFGVWNLGRSVAIWQQAFSLDLGTWPDPRLRLLLAAVWAFCFAGVGLLLWQKRPFTRHLIPLLFLLYILVEFSLFACCVQSPLTRQTWPLPALLDISALLFSAWALNRKAAQTYFTKES